jgi:hypothetical protein
MGATNFKGGIAEDGVVTKRGAGEVTGATLVVATGLTTILGAVVTINEDPGATRATSSRCPPRSAAGT